MMSWDHQERDGNQVNQAQAANKQGSSDTVLIGVKAKQGLEFGRFHLGDLNRSL